MLQRTLVRAIVLCCLVMSSPMLLCAVPAARDVPDYKVRIKVASVEGKVPTTQKFSLTLAGNPQAVEVAGTDWSPWVTSTRAGIETAVANYPNSYNGYWQVVTGLTASPIPAPSPFPVIKLQVESAIGGGETSSTEAELFGPNIGLILWKDSAGAIHIDTLTGHGRRVYDKAMKDAFLPMTERPRKILFGDRYIGGDSDVLSWKEGIQRLSGLGFNVLYPGPANLTSTVRAGGINKIWGAIYNPPGYAFNFKPDRHQEFVKFVQDQVTPALAAGWKKEEIGFWVTSDEPGWYYPAQYTEFNKDPNALAAFHDYLKARGLEPQDFGKASWDEVRFIGRKQYADLPSRRLFYWSNRFFPWASSHFFAEVARAYEEVIRPGVPVLVNFNNFMGVSYQPGPIANNGDKQDPNAAMGQHDWLEFGRERGTTALATEDWFGDDNAYLWSYYTSRLRSAADLSGVGVGSLVIPRVSGQRPGGMSQKLLSLVGNGAKTIQFFIYGPEYSFPVNCYSENTAVYKPLSSGMRLVAKAEDLLYPGKMRQPEVAILTPQSSPFWDLEEQQSAQGLMDVTNNNMYSGRMAYLSESYSLFLALQHSAVPVRFVDEQKLTEPDFKTTKVLYITAPDLPAESIQGVLNWVRGGGTLVTVAGTGLFDRYHQPTSTLSAAAGLTPAVPLRMPLLNFDDAKANGFIMRAGVRLAVFGEREKLAVDNSSDIKAFFDNGDAAITEKRVGKGRIIHFACYPGIAYRKSATGESGGLPAGFSDAWRTLITQPVRLAGAALPVTVDKALIEAPALYSQNGIAVTLLNWSGVPQNVAVTIATDRPVNRVESALGGKLPFQKLKNGIAVQTSIGDVDVLKLYYRK